MCFILTSHRNYPDVAVLTSSFKTCGSVSTKTSGTVPTSHQNCPVFLPQRRAEMLSSTSHLKTPQTQLETS